MIIMLSPAANLMLIKRLRSLRISTDENNAAVENEGSPDAIKDLNAIFSENLLSDDDGGDAASNSDGEEGSCADAKYALCETVDDSLFGLHTLNDERCKLPAGGGIMPIDYEYDWLLDGEFYDDGLTPKSRRRKRFGEPALDNPLELMELEDPSLVTASCSPDSVLDETLESGEGIIEFSNPIKTDDKEDGVEIPDVEWEGFASAEVPKNHSSMQFDHQSDDIQIQTAREDDSFIGCVVDTSNEQVDCSWLHENEISSKYQPSDEIQQLVSNLDAELDITIDECLNTFVDCSTEEQDCLDDKSLEFRGSLQLCLPRDSYQQTDVTETPKSTQRRKDYQQTLLMSSTLMELLPMPIPDMDTDHLALFTFRIQKAYRDAMGMQQDEVDPNETTILDDDIVERRLSDAIHSSYFEGARGDDDNFDSIVLDEVLNVPWPFYQLDLNEPIVEDEYNGLDPDKVDSGNAINFDTYIFNRLSQLDTAKGQVMNTIVSRVSLKEKSIDSGNERILAAEMDVATALMYTNSSRESIQRMLSGYPINGHTHQLEHHNAVMGGLRVLDISDTRDRIQYLGDTIDRISYICDEEVLFWKEIPNLKSHNSTPLRSEQYKSLHGLARKLYDLTLKEEVLNHVTSLHSLRDRIRGLPVVLLECMEDSVADLVRRMLNAENVCDDQYSREYKALVGAWISCWRLKKDPDSDITSQISAIADGWSGCLLKVFCFEISKAYVFSLVDTLESDEASEHVTYELGRLKCSLTTDSDIDTLLNRLLCDRRMLSQHFSHQALRATEILSIYCLFLEWHSEMATTQDVMTEPRDLNELKSDNVSSMSADDLTSSASLATNYDDVEELSSADVPQSFEFANNSHEHAESILHQHTVKTLNRTIRHPLFTFCESKLTQSIEYCMSCSSMKILLEDLCTMDDIFHQFIMFGVQFLGEEYDEASNICENTELSLTELYRSYLRSVHIEAMKSTGTLLTHEKWALTSIEFIASSDRDEEKKSDGACNTHDDQNTMLIQLQRAILELYCGAASSNFSSSSRVLISDRAVLHGHAHCSHLTDFLENNIRPKREKHIFTNLQFLKCGAIKGDLASFLMQFVEKETQLLLPVMTESAANGLVKWTARLLSIGISLTSVVDDAISAVKTLFDLYIMTVFRICGRSTMNENALLEQGKQDLNASKSSSRMLSLTIEADVCSPLHGEDLKSLKNYVDQARERLDGMVNLDKFQASELELSSKKGVDQAAARLEKDVAAAVSCVFAALLADIASQVLSSSDDESLGPSIHLFSSYAMDIAAMTPHMVRQSCRLACVHAISGKDVIFQIMCVGNVWMDDDIQEYSNPYVEDLYERCGELWAILSTSSPRLPDPLLRYTWDHLVRSAFHTLIEGFSKVTNCSTGGRSLMSMDLNTLSDGLNPDTIQKNLIDAYPAISSPPESSYRGEGKQYVDAYIKVFFYPDEVLHQWMSENHQQYREEHMMSLVTAKKAQGKESERFWELLEESIRALYRSN